MDNKLISIDCGTLKATFSRYGASIKSLFFNGKRVLLEIDSVDEFNKADMFFGKTLGRIAGRIPNVFKIGNDKFQVNEDEEGVSLHGGKLNSLSFKLFDCFEEKRENKIIFTYKSKDLENGFPGEVDIKVTYQIINNSLIIFYDACSNKDTLLSFTNHMYFNFDTKDINNYKLKINSSKVGKFKEGSLLINGEEKVKNEFDFSKGAIVKDKLDLIENGDRFLDNYYIFNEIDETKPQVTLSNNDIKLDIYTSFEGCNVFVDSTRNNFNFLNKGVKNDSIRRGIAIECEKKYFPYTNLLLKKDEKFSGFIRYKFTGFEHEK